MAQPIFKNRSHKFTDELEFQIYELINSNGLELHLTNYGARMTSIKLPLKNQQEKLDVILGYDNLADYINDKDYMNAIVGRVANRIHNGSFSIQDANYQLNLNENKHHLHGGSQGFDTKFWHFIESFTSNDQVGVVLQLMSNHLDQGYPGKLLVTASYILKNDNSLHLKIEAESDQSTPVSITNHNYWNFNGHDKTYADITNHHLKINSNLICETNCELIPTGKLIDVSQSNLDFRSSRSIASSLTNCEGIDSNFCFENTKKISVMAGLFCPVTNAGMVLSSNLPGLQCYTGEHMSSFYKGKQNKSYGKSFGICLEPQFFPNAVNQASFASPILLPNEKYDRSIIMKFEFDN